MTPVRIAGELRTTEATVPVRSPYDGELITEVPRCGPDEVEEACAAARSALARDDLPQHRRARVLEVAADLLRQRREPFAATICAEAGKPIATAQTEVDRCVDTLTFAAVEARKLAGELVPAEATSSGQGRVMFALRVPLGVVAAITPFNFPLNLVAHKVAPAIAAGCPVVLKPAPQAPLSAIRFVELLVDAGLPADWISVLTDTGRDAGEPLVAHEIPRMVTFTGSVDVGWAIAAAAPRKRVALELGSASPVIVEPDADVDTLAAKVKQAGFAYAGQSCISVQRLLIHRTVHPEVLDAVRAATESIVVGDPRDPATEMGPMIAPQATERVLQWIEQATDRGGTLVTGGRVEDGILLPTIVDGAPNDVDLCRKEVFGPVVVTQAYDDLDEALDIANDTDLGLHAGIFTNDLAKAMRAVRQLDFGGVLVNEVPTVRVDQQPYGGMRDSGNTREGPAYAVQEMTELRFVSLPG